MSLLRIHRQVSTMFLENTLLRFVQWEAFTLGRSPVAPDSRADVVVADQFPRGANLEVAHGPGSRYLVQRWGDGTFCDKTGKPREVEVQASWISLSPKVC